MRRKMEFVMDARDVTILSGKSSQSESLFDLVGIFMTKVTGNRTHKL